MISLLEKDIVDKQKWLGKDEFLDNLALAQSLPGIMAVNVAIAVGYKLNRYRGCIAAVLGTILPSFLIILAIAMFLTPDTIKSNATLTSIFKGIRPAVVALILAACVYFCQISENQQEELLDSYRHRLADMVGASHPFKSDSLYPARCGFRLCHLFEKFQNRRCQ